MPTTQFFKSLCNLKIYVRVSDYMIHKHKQNAIALKYLKRYLFCVQEVAIEKKNRRSENKYNGLVVLMQLEKDIDQNSDQNTGHFCTFFYKPK